jgi:phosphoglycerol transferase MdoB-like AlkP superfamily enzyme
MISLLFSIFFLIDVAGFIELDLFYVGYVIILFSCSNFLVFLALDLISHTLFIFVSWVLVLYFVALHYYVHYFSRILDLNTIRSLPATFFTTAKEGGFKLPFNWAVFLLAFGIVSLSLLQSPQVRALDRWVILASALVSVGMGAIPIFKGSISTKQYTFQNRILKFYGLVPYFLSNFVTPRTEISRNSPDERYFVDIVPENSARTSPDIFIIQVESMDAGLIGLSVGGIPVMPFLSDLSQREGVAYFPYCLSYHGMGGTSDTEYSVINSMLPPRRKPSMLMDYFPNSLFSHLSSSYKKTLYHGNIGEFYNRFTTLKLMGVDAFKDISVMGLVQSGWGASDQDVFNFVCGDIASTVEAQLSYVITMTSHPPFTSYRSCKGYFARPFSSKSAENDFFNSFHYVDACLENFFRRCVAPSPNPVAFVFGDHASGEAFPGFTSTKVKLRDESLDFVPLIVHSPGRSIEPGDHLGIASLLDIAPTILHAAGESTRYFTRGYDLFRPAIAPILVCSDGSSLSRSDMARILSEKR